MQNVGLKILIIYPWPWFGGVCVQHMNSITQQLNLLVPWWSMCPAYEQHKSTSESLGALSLRSYLTLSNQLELLFFQRCLLIIVFKYISRKNIRQFKSNICQITYHNFSISNVPNKNPVFEHDWSKYSHEEFILGYFTADWP